MYISNFNWVSNNGESKTREKKWVRIKRIQYFCSKEKGSEWDLWERRDTLAGIYKRNSRGVTNHKLGAKG